MRIRYAILGLGSLVLAGCASDAGINREAALTLEPMPKPASLPAETRWTGTAENVDKLVSANGDTSTWMRAEGKDAGCTWTNDGWFSPAIEWTDCGDSGTAQVSKEGDIWPLEVGKSESYDVKGPDWQTTRTCTVKAAVMVSVGDRELPAYEVACEDKWRVRTWYVSPELQQAVRYKNWHKRRGVESDVTLVL